MREVELKAVVPDVQEARRQLHAAGVSVRFEGALCDWRYDTPERSLTARDQVLRVRLERDAHGERTRLEFKGAAAIADGYKVREELGTSAGDGMSLHGILESLGYVVTREVDREIAVYEAEGAIVRFERYPQMDALVEVEGDPMAIERAIARLGIPRASFTAEPLVNFVRRFEQRTGLRAALCHRELAGDYRFRVDDA